jgi:hypothetical protein
MGKKSRSRSGTRIRDPDPGPRSGMNIPDHISESLEQVLGLKYLSSLMRMRIQIWDPKIFLTLDTGWKKFGSRFRDKLPEYATLDKSWPHIYERKLATYVFLYHDIKTCMELLNLNVFK